MSTSRNGWLAGVAVATLAAATPAAAQSLDYSGSIQYSTGEYIQFQQSRSLFLVTALTFSMSRLQVSGSIPLIVQSSPWVVYSTDGSGRVGMVGAGDGATAGIVADTASQPQLGVGDPLLYAGFELLRSRTSLFSLRVTGTAKVPLGDATRGFSTGEWDYAAGLSLSGMLGGTLLFADVAYWIFGDPPGVEYRDPIAYGLGFGRSIASGRFGLLASVFGYTEVIEGVAPPAQASLSLSYLIDSRSSLMGGASFGLTDSSPDIGFSLGWSFALANPRVAR